jgi:hypothetical protein
MKKITFVMTSCDRTDLLKSTFDSFIKNNTFPIEKYLIIDDSGKIGINDFIKEEYPNLNINLIYNTPKLGQIKSIDKAYSIIDTEYVFHCEEDWEFYKPGFIEYSLKILESNSKILQCWLRDDSDTNGQPVEPSVYKIDDIEYRLMSENYRGVWHGFTFNPTLIKIDNYKLIAPYSNFEEEHHISIRFHELGFRAAKCMNGFVRHIGWGRHVY